MSSSSSPALEPRPFDPATSSRRAASLVESWVPGILWLLLLAMVVAWGVDLPYWDQWMMVPLFERALDGTLLPNDLVPRYHGTGALTKAILLLVGLAADWNIRLELVLNVLVAGMLYRVTHARLREERLDPWSRASAALLFALLIFSPAQQENWAWSWKLETWINVLAATLAIVLLGTGRPSSSRLVAALLCGVAASFSYINGVLIWPLGAAVLLLRRDRASRAALACLAVWVAASTLLVSTHLRSYGYPASILDSPPLASATFPRYVLVFLGAPIAHDFGPLALGVSTVAGGAALLVLVALVWRRPAILIGPSLVWPSLAAYALGTAAMTAFARVHLGVEQALSSRYLTYANLFWIGLVGSLAAAASRPRLSACGANRAGPRRAAFARLSRWPGLVSIALAVLVGLQALAEVPGYRDQSTRAEFRGSLRMGVLEELHLPFLYPDPVLLEDYVTRLCRLRLSLFRYLRELDVSGSCRLLLRPADQVNPLHGVEWTRIERAKRTDGERSRRREVLRTARGFGAPVRRDAVVGAAREVRRHGGSCCFAGWAVDRSRLRPAAALAVVVTIDGRVVRATRPERARPHHSATVHASSDRIGFRACLVDQDWAAVDAGAPLRVLGVSAHGFASDLELAAELGGMRRGAPSSSRADERARSATRADQTATSLWRSEGPV